MSLHIHHVSSTWLCDTGQVLTVVVSSDTYMKEYAMTVNYPSNDNNNILHMTYFKAIDIYIYTAAKTKQIL